MDSRVLFSIHPAASLPILRWSVDGQPGRKRGNTLRPSGRRSGTCPSISVTRYILANWLGQIDGSKPFRCLTQPEGWIQASDVVAWRRLQT